MGNWEQKLQNLFKEELAEDLKNDRCFYKHCTNQPINKSHAFQRATIVKQLSSYDDKVYTFSPGKVKLDIQRGTLSDLNEEKSRNATTFPGFCNQHDTKLFRNIEENVSTTSIEEYVFLYSYRGFIFSYWIKRAIENMNKDPSKKLIDCFIQITGIPRSYAIKFLNLNYPPNMYHNQLEKFEELKGKYEKYIGSEGKIGDFNNEFLVYTYELKDNPKFALMRTELFDFFPIEMQDEKQKYPITFGVTPEYDNKPAVFFIIANDDNIFNEYKIKFNNDKLGTLNEIFDLHHTDLIVINPEYYNEIKKDNLKDNFDIDLFKQFAENDSI